METTSRDCKRQEQMETEGHKTQSNITTHHVPRIKENKTDKMRDRYSTCKALCRYLIFKLPLRAGHPLVDSVTVGERAAAHLTRKSLGGML